MWCYLRLAVLIQYRSVTDTHTHTQTDRHTTTAYTTLSKASRSKIHQIFWLKGSRGSRLMSLSNFGKIGQSVTKIFFKVADAAILNFQIYKISLADSGWRAQTHRRAKCRQNRSSCLEILQFFEFSRWPPPVSWIF